MHTILLLFHSVVRYFVLIFLIVLIVRSFRGWQNRKSFTGIDDKVSLWLFILIHTQLLLGLFLYFISPRVIFSAESMKDAVDRYWLMEHGTMMGIVVTLVTIARIKTKKIKDEVAKHKNLFLLNFIALIIALVAIGMSDRGYFSLGGQ